MSTRGCYTFKDENDTLHVYRHSDNYPRGAVEAIKAALPFAWELPRFEADEFAAAFVAGNKSYHLQEVIAKFRELAQKNDSFDYVPTKIEVSIPPKHYLSGGGIRLMKSGSIKKVAPSDIEYRYEITQNKKTGELLVKCWETQYWDDPRDETLIYNGTLEGMMAWAIEFENKANNEDAA